MEMSLNKNEVLSKLVYSIEILVEKTKLVVLRLMRLYIMIPFTLAKIEVRVRNVMLNQRQKMEGIARFAEFYLQQL